MRKLFPALFLALCSALAALPRVAVSDFTVTSSDPRLTYVGKGLSEMVAAQLAASKGVLLIDRGKRDALLKEAEFSLSGLADEASLLKAGQLLSADYFLFGDIVDMGTAILVSCKLVKTETGEVVWQGTHLGSLSDYDAISRDLAGQGLAALGTKPAAAAPALAEASAEKKKEAIIAFSGAVDSLDRKDTEAAKRQLAVAQAIDPGNPAVMAYLAKLTTNTAKFKIIMDSYCSYLNPAFLGIIKQDSFHFAVSTPVMPVYYMPLVEGINYTSYGSERYITETVSVSQAGYSLPLGEAFGVRINVQQDSFDVRTKVGSRPGSTGTGGDWGGATGNSSARGALGANIDLGARIGGTFALGAGGAFFARSTRDTSPAGPFQKNDGTTWSCDLGLLVRSPDESVVWDCRAGYAAETLDVFDKDSLLMTGATRPFPLSIENNLTFALAQRKLFLVLKNVDALSLDGSSFSGSLMPAAECFVLDWLSLRGGVEGGFLHSAAGNQYGLGGMGGLTLRVIPWGMDLDLNISYRQRPSSVIPGNYYPDFLILLNATFNGAFRKSR